MIKHHYSKLSLIEHGEYATDAHCVRKINYNLKGDVRQNDETLDKEVQK